MAADLVPGDAFGTSVSAGEESFLIGSRDDAFGIDSGALYVFDPNMNPFQAESATSEISLASGGQQELLLSTCPPRPGHIFFVVGSASGTSPGFDAGTLHVPLNVDFYFLLTLSSPNVYPMLQSTGILDAAGAASGAFGLSNAENPALAGTVLHHAFGLIDPLGALVAEFSDPVALTLVP